MKKILLLGGSAQQLVAIQKAKKLGYKTILCDYLPDNPGQYISDIFYQESTTNKEKILEIAEREKIDGIVAYASDPAAPTAAFVAEKLKLPGNPYRSVEILCNKDKFRKFLADNNFNTPKATAYTDYKELKKDIKKYKFPVMIKPVDSSGSKGVARVDNFNGLREKFNCAMSFSRVKRVIVEEYVESFGYQVAGDGFSVDGKLVFRAFANDHFDKKSPNKYTPVSASFPYNMPIEIHNKIHSEIQKVLDILQMKNSAYNFDIRIDKNYNVYLMEIGPRNGGNMIPQIIQLGTGVDMVEYTIKAAMGENCDDLVMKDFNGFYAYYAVHSLKAGILKDIIFEKNFKNNNIIEVNLNYSIGDKIPAYTGSNGTLGILLLKFNSEDEMLSKIENIDNYIKVDIEESL